MGSRALVLYEEDPRAQEAVSGPSISSPEAEDTQFRVALHSQNGAHELRLARDITVGSPFGQKNPPEAIIGQGISDQIQSETDTDIESSYTFADGEPREVNPNNVLGDNLSLETAVTELLDFRHYEAVFVVYADYTVDAYRVLGTNFPSGLLPSEECPGTTGEGVLYAPKEPTWESYSPTENRYKGLRMAAAARVRNGDFSRAAGEEYLRRSLLGILDFESGVTIPRVSPYNTLNTDPRYEFAPEEGLEEVDLWEETTPGDQDSQTSMNDF